jgi:hypothetical protein
MDVVIDYESLRVPVAQMPAAAATSAASGSSTKASARLSRSSCVVAVGADGDDSDGIRRWKWMARMEERKGRGRGWESVVVINQFKVVGSVLVIVSLWWGSASAFRVESPHRHQPCLFAKKGETKKWHLMLFVVFFVLNAQSSSVQYPLLQRLAQNRLLYCSYAFVTD